MTKVVKIGGALLENPAKAVNEIRSLARGRTAIVHGGGMQITRMLERMNVPSTFIEGLRVTDESTLAAVCAALLGEVHTALIQALYQQGLPAVGIFGVVRAQKKSGPWGFVGANIRADATSLNAILDRGKMPVIPTSNSFSSRYRRTNGDETAAAVAVALECSELLFLTDVEGVKDAAGAVIERSNNPNELLAASFVSGGMIPKLKAVKAAMEGGVGLVRVGRTIFEGAA